MDIYTKLFLANFIAFLVLIIIDIALDDALAENAVIGIFIALWTLVTILSIPAIAFYWALIIIDRLA